MFKHHLKTYRERWIKTILARILYR